MDADKIDSLTSDAGLATSIDSPIFLPTAKQALFLEKILFSNGKYTQLLFGGAVGGGKTRVALELLFLLCDYYPGSRWALVRKDLPTLRRNTLPSFERYKKFFVGPINKQDWTCKCKNGSEILLFTESIKDDPELNRWRGLEVNGFILEEMNELQDKSFFKAIERAGRWKVRGPQPLPLIVGTCNPSKNWVKQMFYDPHVQGKLEAPRFYLPSYVTDNPYLDKQYIESLASLPAKQYDVFVRGNWESADEPDQLIQSDWVDQAFAREPIVTGEKRLGVDVARYGDDETTLALLHGMHLVELQAFHGINTSRTAELTERYIVTERISPHNVKVDTVGLGAGVADQLLSRKHRVTEFIAGGKPVQSHRFLKFKNVRTEAWWNMRELLKGGSCSFASDLRIKMPKLYADLTAPKYSVDSDKVIEVEPKDEIKSRLGRSTDYGDAVVMAYAHMSSAGSFFRGINTR